MVLLLLLFAFERKGSNLYFVTDGLEYREMSKNKRDNIRIATEIMEPACRCDYGQKTMVMGL